MEKVFNIPLAQVMVKKTVTVNIDAPFSEVEELLRVHNIRHLPVVDGDNVLKGIITQRDLYRTEAPMKTLDGDSFYNKDSLDRYITKHIMTKEVATLSAKDTLASAIVMMAKHKYGCIPVVDEGNRLAGIVTQTDVLKIIAKNI